jgi:hypothetical protein
MYLKRVMSYDRFVDDRLLTSRDALNTTQMKLKLVEIDEGARDFSQRFGRRVLVRKVLLTMKYSRTEEVEEVELDLELLENKLLYHAELQRRNIASILGQIKCCVGLTEIILQLSERTNSPGYNSDESN